MVSGEWWVVGGGWWVVSIGVDGGSRLLLESMRTHLLTTGFFLHWRWPDTALIVGGEGVSG